MNNYYKLITDFGYPHLEKGKIYSETYSPNNEYKISDVVNEFPNDWIQVDLLEAATNKLRDILATNILEDNIIKYINSVINLLEKPFSEQTKFIAFNIETNTMSEPFYYGEPICFNNSFCLYDSKMHRLMAYTGLNDKNGEEIYDGFILKSDKDVYQYGYYSLVEFLNGSYIISIKYDMTPIPLFDMNKVYDPSNYPNDLLKSNWINDLVIVGNKYQNKELLK